MCGRTLLICERVPILAGDGHAACNARQGWWECTRMYTSTITGRPARQIVGRKGAVHSTSDVFFSSIFFFFFLTKPVSPISSWILKPSMYVACTGYTHSRIWRQRSRTSLPPVTTTTENQAFPPHWMCVSLPSSSSSSSFSSVSFACVLQVPHCPPIFLPSYLVYYTVGYTISRTNCDLTWTNSYREKVWYTEKASGYETGKKNKLLRRRTADSDTFFQYEKQIQKRQDETTKYNLLQFVPVLFKAAQRIIIFSV